jgi:hypothetical protein
MSAFGGEADMSRFATYILISNFDGRLTEAARPAGLAVDPPSRAVLSASLGRMDSLETGAGSCALTAATAGGSGVAVAGAGSAASVPVCDDGLA